MPLRSPKPIGTLDELRRDGFNPKEWGSCSEPDKGRNVGCEFYGICRHAARDVAGPVNDGLQIIKINQGRTKVVHTVADCMWQAHFRPQIEANGGVMRTLAKQGEKILVKGTKVRDEIIPGQGAARFHDDDEYLFEVKAYPHTLDHPELRGEAFGKRVMAEEQTRLEEDRIDQARRQVVGDKA